MFEFLIFLTIVASLISIRNPGLALGLLICMIGIEDVLFTQSSYFLYNKSHINIAVGIVVLAAAIGSIARKGISLRSIGTVHLLALALFGFGFLSYFWTIGDQEFGRWKRAIPYMGVFLVLAPLLAREEKALQRGFMWALIIGVPVLVVAAFFCDWGIRGLVLIRPITDINTGMITRETRPLALASLASSLAVISMTSHFKFRGLLLLRLTILGLATYISFLTKSRGQLVAIIGVILIVYPISNRVTNVKGLFFTAIGLVIFAATIYQIASYVDLTRWESQHVEDALAGRGEMISELLRYWYKQPGMHILIGYGICASFDIIGFYPHNVPAEILVELGLVGFGIFMAIMLLSLSNTMVLLTKLEDYPAIRSDVVTILGLIGVQFALCLKQGSLYNTTELFFYTICLSQQLEITGRELSKMNSWKTLFIKPAEPHAEMHPAGY